ncbi:hypothetical protein BM526_12515 [Alteromonas mediterranea]|nr:hypothetical protein BM526_12515 [Alteromonas mediterranea]
MKAKKAQATHQIQLTWFLDCVSKYVVFYKRLLRMAALYLVHYLIPMQFAASLIVSFSRMPRGYLIG